MLGFIRKVTGASTAKKKGDRVAGKRHIAGLTSDIGLDGAIDVLEQNTYIMEELERRGIAFESLELIMDDDEIAAAWEKRSLSVEHRKWSLSDPESEVSQFVAKQLNQHYGAIARDLLKAVMFGIACPELTYSYSKETGQIKIDRIKPLPLDKLSVNKAGIVSVKDSHGEDIELHNHKTLKYKLFPVIYRRTESRPAGTPVLVSLVWVWALRNNVWEFWARYLERFGSPLLVGSCADPAQVDPQTMRNNADMMAEALELAVNSGSLVVGSQDKVTAIGASNGGDSFSIADKTISKRIQKRILGQTLTTDSDGKGSYAMADVHDSVRQEIAASDIAMITPVFQQIVNALVELNFPNVEPPAFSIDHQANLNKDRAERDNLLYAQGVRFNSDYYVSAYGFNPDEFTVQEGAGQPAGDAGESGQFAHVGRGYKFSLSDEGLSDGQKELDSVIAESLSGAGSLVDVEQLKGIVSASKNADDLADRLAAYFDKHEPNESFIDVLAALNFHADILGYCEADKGLASDD